VDSAVAAVPDHLLLRATGDDGEVEFHLSKKNCAEFSQKGCRESAKPVAVRTGASNEFEVVERVKVKGKGQAEECRAGG
jgi:hypothetical protein